MSSRANWIRGGSTLAIALFSAGDVSAQIVKLTHLGGAVEAGTEVSHQETESASGPTRTFDRYRFNEAVKLNVDGYVLTAQLLNFHLGGSFGLRQELLGGSETSGNTETMLFGYDTRLSLFPTKPASFLFFANRFEDEMIQNFGTDTESLSESMGGTLRFSNSVFPVSATIQQRRTKSESDDGFFVTKRDETRRIVDFSGGHTSQVFQAKLRARAEDIDDDSIPPVGDYRVYDSDATISYRWGDYFEKSLRVTGGYFERQGNFDFRNASESASFHWGLTDSLDTSLEQRFDFSETDGQISNTNMAVATLNHRLYESLKTNLNFVFERTDQHNGIRSTYSSSLSTNYEKEMPWNSRLLIDIGLRYRFEDRDFDGQQTINTSENLAITGVIGNFLSNRNVLSNGIEVFESPGGTLLILDQDYTIQEIGDRTSIDIPITSSINVGDVVFVTYVYLSDPKAKIARSGFRIGTAWDAGWIALRYEHDQDDEKLIKGEDQPLQSLRRDLVRLDLRGDWGALEASANALFLINDTGSSKYDEISFGQQLLWRPRPGVHLSLFGSESQRHFRRPTRDMRIITAGVSAFWQISAKSKVRVFGNFRDMHNSDSLNQRDVSLGARGNLRFGKIEVIPSLIWTRRERGESLSNDVRGVLRLRRNF